VAVSVDVLSFVDDEARSAAYAAPGGLELPPVTIEPQEIVLIEGLADGMVMARVELSFAVDFAGTPGSGEGTADVELYFADPDAGTGGSAVYQTTPVFTGSVPLSGGTTAQLADTFEATAANGLLDLFQSGRLVFGLAITFDASGSIDPVAGDWELTAIDALIVGNGDIF
jgi:hypothetical protein